MEFIVQSLTLENFKGAKKKLVNFGEITNISGRNESGKSTILDAFTWLLFGKDQFNRADFEIKTVDKYGNVIPRVDHSVEGVFLIDNKQVTLKRVLREKWEKPRGQAEHVFKGNETEYYINDVPSQMKEYILFVNNIIPESTFKLLAVPTYFNTTLKWQDRRSFLTSIANIPDDDTIAGNEFADLLKTIRERDITLEGLKKEYSERKKKLKKLLEETPGRIDEVGRAMPEPRDYEAIEKQIYQKQAEIKDVDTILQDTSKELEQSINQRKAALRKKESIETLMSDITQRFRKDFLNNAGNKEAEITKLMWDKKNAKDEVQRLTELIQTAEKNIELMKAVNDKLRKEWLKLNESKFVPDPDANKCPTCKQELPQHDVESIREHLLSNFQLSKRQGLEAINTEGQKNKAHIERITNEVIAVHEKITKLNATIEQYGKKIKELQSTPANTMTVENMLYKDAEYITLAEDLKSIVIPETVEGAPNTQLQENKRRLNAEITELQRILNERAVIEQLKARRQELLRQEEEYSQQIADMEGIEYRIECFIKAKMDAVANSVNSMFPTVAFRMFETQINGGEQEVCTCLINGVPFADANRAAQLNAGIEILNVFSKHLNTTAPVFVDNAESVNNLTMPNGQLIAFYVTDDRQLKVTTELRQAKVA